MTMNATLRNLRLEKRLSQESLGELLGVSAQAVSKWEQGITSPDISLLPAIAECFGVTIDSLFKGMSTRKYPGYGEKRHELFTIYEEKNGTDEDFKKAYDAYTEVILSGKASSEDYQCFGLLHKIRASRDREKALYYYRRAITEGNEQRDICWMGVHQSLTNLLVEMGRVEEAISEHRKWVEEEPDTAWAHVSYSYALDKADRTYEAWSELGIALRLAPEDLFVLTFAGDLCAKLGRNNEAIMYWDQIPNDSPSISHMFSKADLLASMGENEKAIKQYEEILEWLESHGFNMELESAYPLRRIAELRNNK